MADVETPNNRATSANDIPNSFTNRSAISARTRVILVFFSSAKIPQALHKVLTILSDSGITASISSVIQVSHYAPVSNP